MGLRLRRPLLLLASGIALFGCTTSSATSAPSTTSTTSGVVTYAKSGVVTVAVPRLPNEWNPLTPAGANAVTAMVMAEVWPQTFVVGDHLPATACPVGGPPCDSVVSKAEVLSVQPLVVSYILEPGASWSDGVPITSSDFIYEWQQQLTVGPTLPAGNPTLGYQKIKAISPPDATSFTVTFSTPYADWPALFSPLVPAHIAAAHGWAAPFQSGPPDGAGDRRVTRALPQTIVSGGPFAIADETFKGGRPISLTLVRNPRYWGPPAHLARIVFRVEASEGATLSALGRNEVQVAELPPGPAVDSLVAERGDLNEQTTLSPTLEQLLFNLADPTLVPAVREAIASAIDRHQLFTNTVGLNAAVGGVTGNRLYLSGAPGSQANDGRYQTVALDQADSLLRTAGYQVDSDGVVRGASGAPLVLHLSGPTNDALAGAVEQQLQVELLQSGIRVEIDNVSERQLLGTVLPRGEYQLAIAPYLLSPYPSTSAVLYGGPVGPTPPDAVGASGASGASPSPSVVVRPRRADAASVVSGSVTRDVVGYEDAGVNALFAEAAGELNQNAGASLYNEIDTDLWAALPTLPLFEEPVTLVTASDLVGVSMALSTAGPMWDAQNWAIQTSPPPTTTTTTEG